jgi:hypothetical protein
VETVISQARSFLALCASASLRLCVDSSLHHLGLAAAILPAWLLSTPLVVQPSASGPALRSLNPPVLLPDGTEFKTWEAPPRFTKTYHVDAKHP